MEQLLQQNTKLLYLDDSYKVENRAVVLSMEQIDGKGTAVLLDQTIFYPQGGGQPADQGQIVSSNTSFNVSDVRLIDGIAYHYGTFANGKFAPSEEVTLHVDSERRLLHTRLHSAGHIIDAAVRLLELPLTPTKGYHFPQGPYVEYTGEISAGQQERIRLHLETKVNELVDNKIETQVVYAEQNQMQELCGSPPEYAADSKKNRIVTFIPKMGCPCGGTHVKNSTDIGPIKLTKIRFKGGQTRISYVLD